MLYDLLKAYKCALLQKLAPASATIYYKKLCLLLEGQSIFDPVGNLDMDKILDKLSEVKHKNRFSQFKNAFLYFCEFQNIALPANTLEHIKTLEQNTRKKRRKLKVVEYSAVDKKIKRLRNKRLKLSYQTMIATGLRVSELSSIAPSGCSITSEAITFSFTAKGGTNGVVTIPAAPYPNLYKDLQLLIESARQAKERKLFYSAGYLQKEAKKLDFVCLDLRRAFAKLEYKKCRCKSEVMKKLRHKSIKATNIYLRSKVKV